MRDLPNADFSLALLCPKQTLHWTKCPLLGVFDDLDSNNPHVYWHNIAVTFYRNLLVKPIRSIYGSSINTAERRTMQHTTVFGPCTFLKKVEKQVGRCGPQLQWK